MSRSWPSERPSANKSVDISTIGSWPPDATLTRDDKMATQLRKIDELAETLSDLAITLDELRDNPEGIDEDKLSEIKAALYRAIAAVDDIENQNAE